MKRDAGTVLAGGFAVAMGVMIYLVGFGILPTEEGSVHAPPWVVVVCGGIFVLAGLGVFVQGRPLLLSLIGNSIIAALAAIGAWVALAGSDGGFSGGLPLVPDELNVKVARGMFALGACVCALMLIPGIRQTLKLLDED